MFCDGTNVNACVTTIVNGNVSGNITVGGNLTVNGNTTLGDATSDTITVTGRFDTNLLPSTDNARDLGSSGNSWKDLYIDGTAYLALVDINGGSIDGATIGANSAAAGTFTTLTSTSTTTLNGTTIPASKTLVDTDSSQSLTNKTINGSNNTITNVSLTTAVTGTLPILNGGTNATTASGARSNILPTYAGNAGSALVVNSGATDAAWTAIFTGGLTTVAVVSALPGSPNANTLYIVTS
jgi:hypothetical protein